MYETSVHTRLPRAGIDRISDAATALATIAMATERPMRAETILVLLDDARRGRAIVVVSGTEMPDDVIDVVERVTHGLGCDEIGAVIVASIRPPDARSRSEADADAMGDVDHADDVDRWLEMSDIASLAGVEVLEWFVISDSICCPRDQLGESPRW